MKYCLRFVLYMKEVKYIDNCNMPYTFHDSLASEVLSWPMVRPYRYNLASYVARGRVRCGFIPLEVWRQRTYALHSYAFIEVIFADGVVLYSKRYEGSGLTHCIPMHTLKWYLQVLLTQGSVIQSIVVVRGKMRWHWLFWDYWVLYLQVFLISIVTVGNGWRLRGGWIRTSKTFAKLGHN
jgi:hypothetical protein